MKQQNSPGSPHSKKEETLKSKVKRNGDFFFDCKWMDSVPRVCPAWSDCQPEVLCPSFWISETAHSSRGQNCSPISWFLIMTTPPHIVLSAEEFLVKKQDCGLEPPAPLTHRSHSVWLLPFSYHTHHILKLWKRFKCVWRPFQTTCRTMTSEVLQQLEKTQE
jgi:hypothetical protein